MSQAKIGCIPAGESVQYECHGSLGLCLIKKPNGALFFKTSCCLLVWYCGCMCQLPIMGLSWFVFSDDLHDFIPAVHHLVAWCDPKQWLWKHVCCHLYAERKEACTVTKHGSGAWNTDGRYRLTAYSTKEGLTLPMASVQHYRIFISNLFSKKIHLPLGSWEYKMILVSKSWICLLVDSRQQGAECSKWYWSSLIH